VLSDQYIHAGAMC